MILLRCNGSSLLSFIQQHFIIMGCCQTPGLMTAHQINFTVPHRNPMHTVLFYPDCRKGCSGTYRYPFRIRNTGHRYIYFRSCTHKKICRLCITAFFKRINHPCTSCITGQFTASKTSHAVTDDRQKSFIRQTGITQTVLLISPASDQTGRRNLQFLRLILFLSEIYIFCHHFSIGFCNRYIPTLNIHSFRAFFRCIC